MTTKGSIKKNYRMLAIRALSSPLQVRLILFTECHRNRKPMGEIGPMKPTPRITKRELLYKVNHQIKFCDTKNILAMLVRKGKVPIVVLTKGRGRPPLTRGGNRKGPKNPPLTL